MGDGKKLARDVTGLGLKLEGEELIKKNFKLTSAHRL